MEIWTKIIEKAAKHLIISTGVVFLLVFIGGAILEGPSRCSDGWASSSIGHRGACSHHGGVSHSGGLALLLSLIAAGAAFAFLSRKAEELDDIERAKRLEEYKKSPNYRPPILCPLCEAQMQERTARKGKNRGNKFYGCSRHPICRGTRDL